MSYAISYEQDEREIDLQRNVNFKLQVRTKNVNVWKIFDEAKGLHNN